MDNSTLRVLLASVGVSFGLGFGMAWHLRAPQAEPATAAVATPAPAPGRPMFADAWSKVGQAPAAPLATLSNNAGVEELWTRALAPQDKQDGGYEAEDRLRKLVQSNPVALRELLQRYNGALTPQGRELLKSVLSTVQTPEVIAFASRLAGSVDTAERKYGFALLQGLDPDSPEVRGLVKRTLATEQSPEVLVQVLAALRAGAAGPEESEQIVALLKSLSQHADPAVRRQSIAQLGQWDKQGEGAERLSQALADSSLEVRSAAVFAIAQTGVRTDAVKAALMGMVNNTQESKDVRGSAMQVLERFSLSKEEYASFAQVKAQMKGI